MRQKMYYLLSGLIGLLVGWLALGWWLWPVAYVGEAYTYELNQADRLRYASVVVDSFALTGQSDPAWFAQWTPEEINQAMDQVAQANPGKANWARALANQASVSMFQPVQVKAQAQTSEVSLDWLILLTGVVILALAIGAIIAGLAIWRNRAVNPTPAAASFDKAFVSHTTTEYIPVQPKQSELTATIHARLTFGPGKPTDQHLPIERDGEHVGEFGVSQVDDQPAWDVWLFDQKALVTVTKVLTDQKSEELASRGEVIGWDGPFLLETSNLKMTGKASMIEAGLLVDLTVEAKDEG